MIVLFEDIFVTGFLDGSIFLNV